MRGKSKIVAMSDSLLTAVIQLSAFDVARLQLVNL